MRIRFQRRLASASPIGYALNMVEATDSRNYWNNPDARRKEWYRYYSEKRIGHQWFQLHLLEGLAVQSVLEIGPNLGLVSALLANAGYSVTTMDILPSQDPRPNINHIRGDLTQIDATTLSGQDAILCCETLEHLPWEQVQMVLTKCFAAQPKYLIISVPYMGFQMDWRLYLNAVTWRSKFSFKKLNFLRQFKTDASNPWGHKWEAGYKGYSLAALEAKIDVAGWKIIRREFTSPTRSVFYLLNSKALIGQA